VQTRIQEEEFQYTSVIQHPLDFRFKVFISSEYAWFPFRLVLNQIRESLQANDSEVKFYEISVHGLHRVGVEGHDLQSPGKRRRITEVVFNAFFWSNILSVFFRVFLVSVCYKSSWQLAKIHIGGVKIGDILAAEYLRDPKYGNGRLKFDLHFYRVVMKYLIAYALFVRDLNKVLKIVSVEDIGYAIQETSFKDEMRRRILIKRGARLEYQFNKFLGKMRMVEYLPYAEGRVLDYTPKVNDLTEEEKGHAYNSMNKRVQEGVQSWTANITDIDPNASFTVPQQFDTSIPIAIVFLHAVADDQYRCGLDEFDSLDGFHRYTIDTLLELGYQCILKSHPGVNSAIHPDKTTIDRRYLTKLFDDYGLNYGALVSSGINDCQYSSRSNRLFALHPKLGIHAIAARMKFLTITHHGNVLFESKHLGLPTVKYRYCKSRAYHFCHDWATIAEYRQLLTYYKEQQSLPEITFRDSYLDVAAVLARKTLKRDYNKELTKVAKEAGIPVTEKPRSKDQVYANFQLIKERIDKDSSFASHLSERFSRFLN
jgi:hypothetical protein